MQVSGNRSSSFRRDPGYAGLTTPIDTLPSAYYFDPAHYQRELTQIWQRNWIYVCRSSDVAAPRSFRTLEIGSQSIVVVRGEDRVARAFHNTCRHRGAALCRSAEGRFPAAGIVCPYHAWRYFAASFDLPLNRLDDWHLADLVVGHRLSKTIECNWKVFWENYNECLHCPGVHPRLTQLVPIFGRALLEPRDDPKWQDHAEDDDPKYSGGLRRGAESWSMDGKPAGVPFAGLSEADRKLAHIYMTCVPSVFIVAHVDYVRIVRLLPLAPERTHMSIEFLFLPETLTDPTRDIMNAVKFTDIVMSEDAQICEINQRGLHALPHECGVLMPEEYAIRQFQDWVRSELART
jgi:Rieske 2Fe-2S family protein